jgi:hypothetical protein
MSGSGEMKLVGPTAATLKVHVLSLPVSTVVETDNNDSIFDPQNQVFYPRRERWRRLTETSLKNRGRLLDRPSLQSNRERIRDFARKQSARTQVRGRRSDRMMQQA